MKAHIVGGGFAGLAAAATVGEATMFAPAHLRAPRRDRAILGGSLVALAVAAWLVLWFWR